jgi:NRPS condensation-like uncharacterized protein
MFGQLWFQEIPESEMWAKID